VIVAADGAEALSVLEDATKRIDLVLSDVITPVLGGPELATRIAKSWPAIPVVLMSGYPGERSTGERSAAHGRVVEKPFTGTGLTRAVRDALDR
jgi:CheY-like chemotaxis protein